MRPDPKDRSKSVGVWLPDQKMIDSVVPGPDPEMLLPGGGGTESRSHEPSDERGESMRGGGG